MNERIKELAVAAAPANSSIPQSEWNIPKEFIEKFAELIVRECIDIARVEEGHSPFEGPVETKIKQHFGVEE